MKTISFASIALLSLSLWSAAQVISPVQSAARPFNLDIVAPVMVAGSDAAAKDFQANALPGMLKLISQNLGERSYKSNAALNAVALDPSKLVMQNDAAARVYFLGEGAGFRNTLGFSTMGGSPLSPDAQLIFPNASSSIGYGGSGKSIRTSDEPLVAGDFVDLGSFKAGTKLDFFIIANGFYGGKEYYSTEQSVNMDGVVHAVSLASNGSAYLIIGFEDLKGGGDRDYNDLVFAVEIGSANVKAMAGLGAPEPSLAMGALIAAVGFLGFSRQRQSAFSIRQTGN
jgi:hypothetical protein